MKSGMFLIAALLIAKTVPASALEPQPPQREEQSLRIELEPVPGPGQQTFDRYVQELAAAAQKDATPEERARKDDAIKEQQPKVFNPIALSRW